MNPCPDRTVSAGADERQWREPRRRASTGPVVVRRGAYGLHLAGLAGVDELLVDAAPAWPTATITVERGSIDGIAESLDESSGTMVFRDAVAHVRRMPAEVVFRFPGKPRPDAIVHPYLAPVAGLLAHWEGREALHAGAFMHDGAAWGLVADRGGGKSSTLATLALDGVPVVADDLLVIDGRHALAGPRAVDLREEPARALGVGDDLGVLGTRGRWRLGLPVVPATTPLRGWIFLDWGSSLSAEEVSAPERLERLGAQRMIRRRPLDPSALLRLASLPAIAIRRPQSWAMLREATCLLLDSLPGRGTTG